MQSYIGTKQIEAKPMNLGEYNKYKGWTNPPDADPAKEGYLVKYSDSYVSWSPKDVFEKAYLPMDDGNTNTITQKMVDEFISYTTTRKDDPKTTLVRCELVNGYVIYETSSCVDHANYNEELGHRICMERIRSKVWELLGFLLQTATYGIKN